MIKDNTKIYLGRSGIANDGSIERLNKYMRNHWRPTDLPQDNERIIELESKKEIDYLRCLWRRWTNHQSILSCFRLYISGVYKTHDS